MRRREFVGQSFIAGVGSLALGARVSLTYGAVKVEAPNPQAESER